MSERTKRCPRCQKVKPWSDYHPKVKWEDGTVRRVQAYCKPCDAQNYREWTARNPERTRELRRQSTARLMRDPEWAAQRRDYMREDARRRRNSSPARYRYNPCGDTHGGPTVDATAFTEWLRSFNANPEQTAKIVGMNPRRVHALFNGEQTRVELDTVDRALCGYGRPDLLDALYPVKAKDAA